MEHLGRVEVVSTILGDRKFEQAQTKYEGLYQCIGNILGSRYRIES